MTRFARVAHASRVLATVFHRRELFLVSTFFGRRRFHEKCVALEQRNQHTGCVRYPEQILR